jgi:CHAT domain-containing protein/Tfp pilus assembly protein PilF
MGETSSGQEAERLNQDAQRLLAEHRFAEAEAQMRQALAVLEADPGADPDDLAAILNNLAIALSQQGAHDAAEEVARRMIALCEGPPPRELLAQGLFHRAQLAERRGDLAAAEPAYRRAVEILEQQLGPEAPELALRLNQLGYLLFRRAKLAEAEVLCRRALGILERALGEDARELCPCLNDLGLVLQTQGDHAGAERLFRRHLAIEDRAAGGGDPSSTALHNLAQILFSRGDYAAAEPFARRALEVTERAVGAEHADLVSPMGSLGVVLHARGDHAAAEPWLRRAVTLGERTLGAEHEAVIAARFNLGCLLRDTGRLAEAAEACEHALALAERTAGAVHPRIARIANGVGLLRWHQGEYQAAADLYRRALAIWEALAGPSHPEVATVVNNLASVFHMRGDYRAAEPLYRRALAIWEATLDDRNVHVGMCLHNLANLAVVRADYAEAEALVRRAVPILRAVVGDHHPTMLAAAATMVSIAAARGRYDRAAEWYADLAERQAAVLGPEHPDLAGSLAGLASALLVLGQVAAGETAARRALAIYERSLGPDHPLVVDTLRLLADARRAAGDLADARRLLEAALAIYDRQPDPESPRLASNLLSLVYVLRAAGKHEDAVAPTERALAIGERIFGPEHPFVARCAQDLGLLLDGAADPARVRDLLERGLVIEEHHLGALISHGSEVEKIAYMATLRMSTDIAVSLDLRASPGAGACGFPAALDTVLQRKGRILDALSRRAPVTLSPDQEQERQGAIHRLAEIRAEQARRAFAPSPPAHVEHEKEVATALEREARILESALAAAGAQRAEDPPVTVAAVRAAIPAGAALLELVRYHPCRPKAAPAEFFGAPRYAAYLITAGADPRAFDLGDAAPIEAAVAALRKALASPVNTSARSAGRDLHERILRPLHDALVGCETVLISPDGQLSLVPFEALVDEEDRYLIETRAISYVTSGRDFLRHDPTASHREPPMVLADPDYDGSLPEPPAPAAATDADGASPRAIDLATLRFTRLAGTRREADALRSLLPDARVLTGQGATESALREARGPRVLHIATHGFFLPDEPATQAEPPGEFAPPRAAPADPLLRSGLAFAGANRRGAADGMGDGIITARELAGLDLQGTRLVVLSACETGLGDVHNGEGVYGLRRALVIAGAETQVISLWKVSDRTTCDLMTDFYGRLRAGESRLASLRGAKLACLARGRTAHPFFWASFILAGDPSPMVDPR